MSTFATRMCSSALSHGRLARDLRPAWEKGLDRRTISGGVADGDPVADRGHAAHDLVIAQATASVGQPVPALAAYVVAAAVLRDDASRLEASLCMSCEGRLELVGPAQLDELSRGQGSIGQRKTPSLGWRT